MNELEVSSNEKFGVIKKDRFPTSEGGRYGGMRDQLDWMKRQMEYITFSEQYKLRYNLKRGEIYEIDWGLNVNAEFSNRHYGVVLMDSNEFNPLVIVCL
ncbi:MAG: type II toxin-antitoxin system PemK/MazF family toxin [Bacilli bacterium]|nr:type II toxin-antitoxin system PemK/MazF family toxin [Bacilli bacterium]